MGNDAVKYVVAVSITELSETMIKKTKKTNNLTF